MSILMKKRNKAQTTQVSGSNPLYLVGLKSNAEGTAPSAVGKHNGTLQTPAEDDSEGYYEGSYEYYDEEDGGGKNTALYNDPFCSGKKG